jgi:hypothetical protein
VFHATLRGGSMEGDVTGGGLVHRSIMWSMVSDNSSA